MPLPQFRMPRNECRVGAALEVGSAIVILAHETTAPPRFLMTSVFVLEVSSRVWLRAAVSRSRLGHPFGPREFLPCCAPACGPLQASCQIAPSGRSFEHDKATSPFKPRQDRSRAEPLRNGATLGHRGGSGGASGPQYRDAVAFGWTCAANRRKGAGPRSCRPRPRRGRPQTRRGRAHGPHLLPLRSSCWTS